MALTRRAPFALDFDRPPEPSIDRLVRARPILMAKGGTKLPI
jgi:hypothetical protein